MSIWIQPVYDRTREDVLNAKDTLSRWITENPTIFSELKGCLNVTDLNRIEVNIDYLSEMLNSFLYVNTVDVKEWSKTGLPNVTDCQRIITNIKEIFNTFCKPTSAMDLPINMTSFDDINRLEQNLEAIKQLLDIMQSIFPLSGVCIAGSRTLLPLRR